MNSNKIEIIVQDYILANPEIIPQAIERLQAKRTASLVDRHRTELETPFAGGWEGAKDGDGVLVEFFDYACGYCKASRPDLDRLLRSEEHTSELQSLMRISYAHLCFKKTRHHIVTRLP